MTADEAEKKLCPDLAYIDEIPDKKELVVPFCLTDKCMHWSGTGCNKSDTRGDDIVFTLMEIQTWMRDNTG